MVELYWKVLPAFHVLKSYGKMVPLRHPMVKAYLPRASRRFIGPPTYLAT